jgi:hypothetical protein
MKRTLALLIITLMPAVLFAAPMGPPCPTNGLEPLRQEAGLYVKADISLLQTELGEKKLGDFSVEDLVTLRDRLSIARQKDQYVERIAAESFLLPGLGQLEVGDTASGLGFLALDLGVFAGTLAAVYCLLPSDLRFDRLNYFGDATSTIQNTWSGHSITDYLPSVGALFGGLVIDQIVRQLASAHARGEAVQAVDQDKVRFTPRIGIGFMGFDIRY